NHVWNSIISTLIELERMLFKKGHPLSFRCLSKVCLFGHLKNNLTNQTFLRIDLSVLGSFELCVLLLDKKALLLSSYFFLMLSRIPYYRSLEHFDLLFLSILKWVYLLFLRNKWDCYLH